MKWFRRRKPPAIVPTGQLTVPTGTSYRTGTAPSGGPLPVEAQIFLRIMGEDLSAARDLIRDMPALERAILMFYTDQIAQLVYEADARDGDGT